MTPVLIYEYIMQQKCIISKETAFQILLELQNRPNNQANPQ